MPSPFAPFDTQYSAHTDVTIHPTTGVVTITVAFHPNNKGGYNCKIWELDPPYTGQPRMVRDWVQGRENVSVGPFGHGASVALPTGGVLTVVPVAAENSEVKPSIMIDAGLGTPYALGTGGEQGPPGPPGAGGTVLLDHLYTNAAWEGRTMQTGGVWVNIPSVFGVPSAPSYEIRISILADRPDVRLRAGTEASPAFVTVPTQVAGIQNSQQGRAPGPDMYISVVNGPAQVWVQVCGYERG